MMRKYLSATWKLTAKRVHALGPRYIPRLIKLCWPIHQIQMCSTSWFQT